jgi:hypothetical protein
MEALDALAVAERHIRALRTARADRGRAGDFARSARREPVSPFQSARGSVCEGGYRSFHAETACAELSFLAD